MKKTASLLLLLCLLISLAGCGKQPGIPPETSEPETPPAYDYDARTQTLTVQTGQDFSALTLPEEIRQARVLEVHGDALEMSVYLPVLRRDGWDEQAELPGLLERTAQSLRFLRQYLHDNAGTANPSALAEKPVVIRIDNCAVGYRTEDGQITLQYADGGTHREFTYLLALMDSDAVGWEQIGYAWYVGTCIDPYSEIADAIPMVPELPYYPQCIAGGVDPENMSASDFRTVYDACARVCFARGLTGWGSTCESAPVTSEPVFTRTGARQTGDMRLSAFMAASFLAWLDDAYGFEQVSRFCFGQISFEDAFGLDFQSAFDQWRAWIEETYPAG